MAKKTIKVRELEDVHVSHISLVEKGANRIPFRIIKNEKEDGKMLDISNLFLRKKDTTPQIVGIALEKGNYSEDLITQLKDAGFEGTIDNEAESATLVKAEGFDTAENVEGVKLENGMVVMVSHLAKALDRSYDNTFAQTVAVDSVLPGVRVATEVFVEKMWDITYESMSKSATTDAISTMFNDFESYVLGLVNAVPEPLFKMEKIDVASTSVAGNTTGASADKVADKVEKAEEEAPKDDESGKEADKATKGDSEDDKSEDETNEDEGESKESDIKKSEDMDEIKSQLETITKSLGVLATLKDSVDNLSTRVEKAETTAAELSESVNGITLETTNEDSIKKSEDVNSNTETFSSALAFDGFEQV